MAQRFANADAISKGLTVSNPHLEKIRREIAILKKCAHPCIVGLREVIDDPRSQKIFLVLEYLDGGEIQWQTEFDAVPKPILSLEESRHIFRDLVRGVLYRIFIILGFF